MPTQQELRKQLYDFMTTGEFSSRGHGMHGGTAVFGGKGKDEDKRNALAGNVADSIAGVFEGHAVTTAEAEAIQVALGKELRGKSRTDFAAAFGAPEGGKVDEARQQGFVTVVLTNADVEAPKKEVAPQQQKPQAPTTKVEGVVEPKTAEIEAMRKANERYAADAHARIEEREKRQQEAATAKREASPTTPPLGVVAEQQAPTPPRPRISVPPLNMEKLREFQTTEAERMRVAEAGRQAAVSPATLSPQPQQVKAMEAASKVFVENLQQMQQLQKAGKLATEGTKHIEAYADQLLASVKAKGSDVKYHDRILGGAPKEVQLAVLEAVQTKLTSAGLEAAELNRIQGWCAARKAAVEQGKVFNPERRAGVAQSKAMPSRESEEELLQRLEEGLNSPATVTAPPPAPLSRVAEKQQELMPSTRSGTPRDQATMGFEETKRRQVRGRSGAVAPQPEVREGEESRNRTTLTSRGSMSEKPQYSEDDKAVFNYNLSEGQAVHDAFEHEKAEYAKLPKGSAFPDSYREARAQYDKDFQEHMDAYATQLVQSGLSQEQDRMLAGVPPEVQKAILEAVGKKLAAEPDLQQHANLRNWHGERSAAVDNGVQFDPSRRTNVEQRFMGAKKQENTLYWDVRQHQEQVLQEKKDGNGGLLGNSAPSQKVLDDAGKKYNEAVRASEREKKTLQMEQAAQRSVADSSRARVAVDPAKVEAGADARLAKDTKARSSYVDYLPRYGETRLAVQDRVGGLGLVQTAKDRLKNAQLLTSLATMMQQDAGAMSRDFATKKTHLLGEEDKVGIRGRIAAVQPEAMRENVRAKVVQDILKAGNPPFFQGMDQKQRKTFYDAVEKQTTQELDQLKQAHKELNAGSLLQTDAVTKMEKAHKEMITIRDKDLQKLKVKARDLEHHNEAIAAKDAAMEKANKAGGLANLAPAEQVKLVVAVGKCAALGLYDKENEKKFQEALGVLPPAEKANLLKFKQKCDLNKEVGKSLEQQEALQKQYDGAKQKKQDTTDIEHSMSQNKAAYGETLNKLGKLLAEEHEATTKAVEQQKESVTVSGKFQRWFNDNVKSGTFAEGEKVLNARKLKDLETQQVQLNTEFAKVTKMADQHRTTYLDAKNDYEKAATKVEQQLQTAETATEQYKQAGKTLELDRSGKSTQLVEAMHVMGEVDAGKKAVLERAGHGQSQGLVGNVDPASLLDGATKGTKAPPKAEPKPEPARTSKVQQRGGANVRW
ncbi:MAG: hypothetical protein KBC27_01200 [Rickettsiales bacterium]|nr:hypothetical protein [Rickettsiales bacterium]